MKTSSKIVSGLVLSLVAGGAFAGNVSNSKHNMGSGTNNTRNSRGNVYNGTSEICVFCHTPHGSTTTNTEAPLWNRTLTDAASYTLYSTLGTSTLDGAQQTVGSVSIACLSCHDGTQALNSVVNSPGSGGANGGSNAMTGSDVDETSGAGTTGWTEFSNFTSGATVETDKFFFIGTDLTNDHPIGIQYAGGGDVTTQASHVDDSFNVASVATTGTGNRYYVDTNSVAGFQKADLPLFARGGTTNTSQYVECASCHDPHNGGDVTFLRHAQANEGSATCLACHNK
jgi:hypothetical protein